MSSRVKSSAQRPIKLRAIALPTEHGGWGFITEPILLGLLVAFSWQALLLAGAALGVFLVHQPLKIATKDHLKGRTPPRLIWAQRFVVGYALLASVPMLILLATQARDFMIPILLAIPLGVVQFAYDARNQSRQLLPELCGALALAAVAPSMVIIVGWDYLTAFILWSALAVRSVGAILYVRSRIKLTFNRATKPAMVWGVHILALLWMMGLVAIGQLHALVLFPFVVLLLRALKGLSRYRRDVPIKVIGFSELAYGLLTVLFIAASFWLG